MKTESEQVQRWDDIIFEKRNKVYGAYAIRKSYDDHVLTGWVISLGVATCIFLFSFLSIEEIITPPLEPSVPTGFMPPPKFKLDVQTAPTALAPKQVNRNLPPVLTQNDPPDQKIMDPIQPRSPGVSGGTELPIDGPPQKELIPGNIPEPPKPEFVLYAEIMPAYEGGLEAMMKFIQKKLRYPALAERKKDEGTVYISFVISSMGIVTNVEVIKGISKECDKEAMRVISMMNKWKPGLQDKMPVAVKLVLPIKFKLDN